MSWRRNLKPALCCGIGGGLGALWGYYYGMGLQPPTPVPLVLGAALGAILGSFIYALIE